MSYDYNVPEHAARDQGPGVFSTTSVYEPTSKLRSSGGVTRGIRATPKTLPCVNVKPNAFKSSHPRSAFGGNTAGLRREEERRLFGVSAPVVDDHAAVLGPLEHQQLALVVLSSNLELSTTS